jgi:hypothetical protein
MRRPAVLAFSLFAIAASLPAEVRDCLPMRASCGHHAAAAVLGCSRMERRSSCPSQRPAGCPKTRPTRDASNCRLHPTPPILRQAPTTEIAAPLTPARLDSLVGAAAPRLARPDWREAPALRPRASPAAAPRSPRPPPFTV